MPNFTGPGGQVLKADPNFPPIDGSLPDATGASAGDALILVDDGNEATSDWLPLSAQSDVIVVVDAGTDLDTARPVGAAAVYWMFDAGVDVGASGVNVTNVVAGDLIFVADA
jgi:hypothetical protein